MNKEMTVKEINTLSNGVLIGLIVAGLFTAYITIGILVLL